MKGLKQKETSTGTLSGERENRRDCGNMTAVWRLKKHESARQRVALASMPHSTTGYMQNLHTSCSLILCNRASKVKKSKLPCMAFRWYSNSMASKLPEVERMCSPKTVTTDAASAHVRCCKQHRR